MCRRIGWGRFHAAVTNKYVCGSGLNIRDSFDYPRTPNIRSLERHNRSPIREQALKTYLLRHRRFVLSAQMAVGLQRYACGIEPNSSLDQTGNKGDRFEVIKPE
jgi:hypothetical protein